MSELGSESTKRNSWTIPEPLAVREARMADGTSILVRRHGNPDGTRIVLSHANGLGADTYYPFWSLLLNRFDLINFDFRNHGWNDVGPVDSHSIPNFVSDLTQVVRDVGRFFGPKPVFGVFHSMSAQTAMIEACSDVSSFEGLILFDPFVCPKGCDPGQQERLMKTMRTMVDAARRRRASFESQESFAVRLEKAPAFQKLLPGVTDLIARTTSRLADDSSNYTLRCPPEYEARIAEQGYRYATSVDVDSLSCPVKVIGSDPIEPHSYMPTVAMNEVLAIDYDFIPETTHFLQLEEPEACISAMLSFQGRDGSTPLTTGMPPT